MKNFVCVKFTNGGTSDIVHCGWMVDTSLCKWPNSGDIQQMARDCVLPEPNWKVYACKILCQSKSYDRCLKKAYTLSDVESSEEENSLGQNTSQNDCFIPPLVRNNSLSQERSFLVPDQSVRAPKKQKAKSTTMPQTANLLHEIMRLSAQLNQLTRITTRLERKVDSLLVMKDDEQFFDFKPASNEFELNNILQNVTDYKDIAKRTERASLRSTIRSFIKLFFSQELAITYSWSGLGNKRQPTKKSFKKHQVYTLLTRVLQFTSYKDATIDNIENEVKVSLAGVGDWNGGREERRQKRKEIENSSESDSNTSTDTIPCEDCNDME
uniref:Uncharacterized protein LOC108949781 n=1 Tax=Phallusia mammillata TaxID=59560 RepID=A0A6F9DJF4_9ASCI|nr:uncharacterized protein LOC108949781 [Phallusia mammillata]